MAERMTLQQVREWCSAYPKDPIFVQDGYDYGHWILNDEQENNFFTRVIMEELKCWTARPTEEQMIGEYNE